MTPTPRDGRDEATASALRRALNDEANQVVPTDRWSEIESQLGTGSGRRWTRWAAPLTVAAAAGTIAVLVWTTTSTQAGPNEVGPAGTPTSTVSVSPGPPPERSVPAPAQDPASNQDPVSGPSQDPEGRSGPASAPSGSLPAVSEAPGADDRSPQARPESAAPQTEAAQTYPPTGGPIRETDALVPSAGTVQSPSGAGVPSGPATSSDGAEVPKLTTSRSDGQDTLPGDETGTDEQSWDTASGKPASTSGSGARSPGTYAKSDTIELKAPGAPILPRDNVRILGGASVFEGALSWQLSDEDGPVASGFETASAGAPDWGTFAIELGTMDPGNYTVWVWSNDPQGGSPLSQAQVGFTVG